MGLIIRSMPTRSPCSWHENEATIHSILSPNREEVFRKRSSKSDLEEQEFPDPILATALGRTAVRNTGSMKA